MRPRFALLALAATLLAAASVQAAPRHAPRFGTVLALLGGGQNVPSAWAGVWQNVDSTYTGCDVLVPAGSSSETDTLCTGQTLLPDTTGFGSMDCNGTVTDTQVDVTCTGSSAFDSCTVDFTYHITGTRTGNSALFVTTLTQHYSPPSACFFLPDACTRFVSRGTRIAPEPPTCGTPARRTTWGTVKTLYR